MQQFKIKKADREKDAIVLHIGCGMDSRVERVGTNGHFWYDIDFPDVILERRKYYQETDKYYMIEADVRINGWMELIPRSEHEMTPEILVNELTGMEKAIFKKLYSGSIAKKMYHLYEYVNI